jgi:cytoplasmic iron level regulating protein YaaA (DUF328/UPF0246 family)
MAEKIALVACVSKKAEDPQPAADLYQSAWFKKASAYAKQNSSRWYILSAKHGLIPPEQVIHPYDETLNDMKAAHRRSWANNVKKQLRSVVEEEDQVIILAGVKYREDLIPFLNKIGCAVEIPMEGLRIGEQMSWLNQKLDL